MKQKRFSHRCQHKCKTFRKLFKQISKDYNLTCPTIKCDNSCWGGDICKNYSQGVDDLQKQLDDNNIEIYLPKTLRMPLELFGIMEPDVFKELVNRLDYYDAGSCDYIADGTNRILIHNTTRTKRERELIKKKYEIVEWPRVLRGCVNPFIGVDLDALEKECTGTKTHITLRKRGLLRKDKK